MQRSSSSHGTPSDVLVTSQLPSVTSHTNWLHTPDGVRPGQKFPLHTPSLQTSSLVHLSASSHGTPLLAFLASQPPVSGLQMFGLHVLPLSGHSVATPTHWPPEQKSPVVHPLLSSHGPSSSATLQFPSVHTMTWHCPRSGGAGQNAPEQIP